MERLTRAAASADMMELARLAALPADRTDEHGVPIAVYAIPRLQGRARAEALRRLERSWKESPHVVSATGLHLMEEIGADVKEMVADAEAAERFARETSVGVKKAGEWIGWGTPLYLVGFGAGKEAGEVRFRAVATSSLPLPLELSLERGSPLGEPFEGLRVALPPLCPDRRQSGGTRGCSWRCFV